MYPDAEKILKFLKEPLLWVGAFCLCIPVLASGQLGKLKNGLSFDHGPHVHNVAISDTPGSASRTSVSPSFEPAPTNFGSRSRDFKSQARTQARDIRLDTGSGARDIALGSGSVEPETKPAPVIKLPAMKDGSQSRELAISKDKISTRERAATRAPAPELKLPERELKLTHTQPEAKVAISALPPTTDIEPGSIVDAGQMQGYENTEEPQIGESVYRAPEPVEPPEDESFELTFIAPTEESISLDPSPDFSFEEPTGTSNTQPAVDRSTMSHSGSSSRHGSTPEITLAHDEPSEISSLPEVNQFSSTESIAIDSPAINSPALRSSQADFGTSIGSGYFPSSLPPTPMKFQAALRARSGNSYSGGRYQSTSPLAPQTYFQHPNSSTTQDVRAYAPR